MVEDLIEYVGNGRLYMDDYSRKMFPYGTSCEIIDDEDFLDKAGEGDICFVEDKEVLPYRDKIEEIIAYRWNRLYPGDFYFKIDLTAWQERDWKEFEGFSHELITREIYTR